jgi:hypothetical protein
MNDVENVLVAIFSILVVVVVWAFAVGVIGLGIWAIFNYILPMFGLKLLLTIWQCIGIGLAIMFVKRLIFK